MTRAELTALAVDVRLTPYAVRVVLDVARRGKGEHAIPMSQFRMLLGVGEDKAAEAVRLAADRKWITRKPGGRGRNDLFSFTPGESAELIARETGLSSGEYAALNGGIAPAKNGTYTLSPGETTDLSPPRTRVDEEKRDVDVDGDVANSVLSSVAANAIEKNADKLTGCRDALSDYLRARVIPQRQAAYVFSILGWLNGIDENVWKFDSGEKLAEEKRVDMLANALNDLAAGDESRLSRPVGDVANLRTKINVLLNPPRRSRPSVSAAGPQKFDYSNSTTKFRGFTR